MPGRKSKKDRPKQTYSRIRKPVPPPTKVEKDRRRKIRGEQARRDAEEAEGDVSRP